MARQLIKPTAAGKRTRPPATPAQRSFSPFPRRCVGTIDNFFTIPKCGEKLFDNLLPAYRCHHDPKSDIISLEFLMHSGPIGASDFMGGITPAPAADDTLDAFDRYHRIVLFMIFVG